MRALWRRVLELVGPPRSIASRPKSSRYHVEPLVDAKRRAGFDEGEAAAAGAPRARQRRCRAASRSPKAGPASRSSSWCSEARLCGSRVAPRAGCHAAVDRHHGVGIGVSTMLFALVSGIVLQPLPYPEPERLVRIFDTNPQLGVERAGAASGNIDDWRRAATRFEASPASTASGAR